MQCINYLFLCNIRNAGRLLNVRQLICACMLLAVWGMPTAEAQHAVEVQQDTIVYIAPDIAMHFVRISKGTYTMGSPDNERGRQKDEGPQHEVKINRPFYLSKYEVTQGQFEEVMGYNPAIFDNYADSDRHPVENVTWQQARTFTEELSARLGCHFRLPTEAEWEYACRAGSQTPYYWGERMAENGASDYAWANSRSMAQTHPVGEKRPNAWGLYDMSGNVWEWCSDWYGAYSEGSKVDPDGPDSGKNKVFRGGSWYDFYESHRCANRHRHAMDKGYTAIGFRVVMEAK
jgi:formylglycine-generating enzyme required for sulfatase activity